MDKSGRWNVGIYRSISWKLKKSTNVDGEDVKLSLKGDKTKFTVQMMRLSK
jgi:hypothetical protein